MKEIINISFRCKLLCIAVIILFGCNDLDVTPLSTATSNNWYSTDEQFDMALYALYDLTYWDEFRKENQAFWLNEYTDDGVWRYFTRDLTSGSVTSNTDWIRDYWSMHYNCIQNANRIIESLNNTDNINEDKKELYEAEARFHRAAHYSRLIFYWGDVPYYKNILTVEEAFSLSRKDKLEILQEIYLDFDFAASYLPISYSGNQYDRATKGIALALKARIALYMGDYSVARDAAKACIDLGIYELYPEYQDIFSSKIRTPKEVIFGAPRSVNYGVMYPKNSDQLVPRNNHGYSCNTPTWSLLASYLCTDGLPIDESPLFDPHNPFKNRDPRCTKTILEFGTELDGIVYEPHPDSLVTYDSNTGKYITNNDTRANHNFASFNGLMWRKWVNGETDMWTSSSATPEVIVIRYADVFLIYAEAKIELDEIDQSVLDAINRVRARAYGVDLSSSGYPKVTTTIQSELRKQLRVERKMEFACEGLARYCDLIRWGLAEKALNTYTYGLLPTGPEIREKLVEPGLWFWGDTPPIDEDGFPDFEETEMVQAGRVQRLSEREFPERQYLWPIPSSEILINENMTQNPGY